MTTNLVMNKYIKEMQDNMAKEMIVTIDKLIRSQKKRGDYAKQLLYQANELNRVVSAMALPPMPSLTDRLVKDEERVNTVVREDITASDHIKALAEDARKQQQANMETSILPVAKSVTQPIKLSGNFTGGSPHDNT